MLEDFFRIYNRLERGKIGGGFEHEVATTAYYHSAGGEWWELYNEQDGAKRYYKHTLFWKGAGYMQEHTHSQFDERIKVVFGEAVYYVEGKRYTASTGDIICIPAGKRHVNPFSTGRGYLILVDENPNENLIRFFKYFHNQVEAQEYSSNRHALPTNKQLTNINKQFSSTICFTCRGSIANFLKQLSFHFEAIW
jgi:mannose-6-phosphate isomerase-like protein (cupin superfamily)